MLYKTSGTHDQLWQLEPTGFWISVIIVNIFKDILKTWPEQTQRMVFLNPAWNDDHLSLDKAWLLGIFLTLASVILEEE